MMPSICGYIRTLRRLATTQKLHYVTHGRKEGRRYKPEGMTGPSALDRFVTSVPSDQNILDLFQGKWSTKMPNPLRAEPGYAQLFNDQRITWAAQQLGPVEGMNVLELGPLEGAHSKLLHDLGADKVVAVEGNAEAFIRCLCVKELFRLDRVRFLLGDFNLFLDNTSEHFDLIVACGVLYHMTDPIKLLRRLTRSSDRVFIWTHYYDPKLVATRDDAYLFRREDDVSAVLQGYSGVKKLYSRDAVGWSGFTGGMESYAIWLRRDAILKFLADEGYRSVDIAFEDPQHPNGPCFSVAAKR